MDSGIILPQPTISTFCQDAVGTELTASATATFAAATWTSGLAVFIPFIVRQPFPVRRLFWANGSTITTTNADAGIYTLDGRLLFSTGATAMVGASAVQAVTADRILTPDTYYLAWTCNGTTNRAWTATITALAGRWAGLKQMTSAYPLPATATLAQFSGTNAPMVGITVL